MSEAIETAADGPAEPPSVLDLLIVGGGPAGTAAAFRAKELGLSALVIDYDDLMKRIRDYAKDKPILPGFGGGDQMSFPEGGPLISELHFSEIDKDEMCRQWKELYRRHDVPAQVGTELVGLEEAGDGIWKAKCWNPGAETEQSLLARHIVLAVGRGVPRTFDIAGNTDGISFRLTEPQRQVGEPACVIGGGTSAAEAVIAISNAKCAAGDASAVYWSYRGDKMPKVSKALAQVFFEAFVGNGNIQYLANSEPVSVFTAPDNRDYLCIRTARKIVEGMPSETTHLEFSKPFCIACIGEDLPVALLRSIGINQVRGGPKNKARLPVSPLLETSTPNIYLAGDLLSPAYLETENFDADPSTFREVKRRGNVKSALRDGVMVAEVVAQKLKGETSIHVRLEFAAPPESVVEGAPQPGSAPQPAPTASVPRLIRTLHGDVQAEEFPLPAKGAISIGRVECDICFAEDTRLSDRHATITRRPEGYFVQDEKSRAGVFLQPAAGRQVEAAPGAVVRVGKQWLIFGGKGNPRTVVHYDHRGKEVNRIQLADRKRVLGRRAPDVDLDSSDPALSRRHLAIWFEDGKTYLRDLESVNGTHIKVDSPTAIAHGDRIWIGQQVLEFSSTEEPSPASEVLFDTTEVTAHETAQAAQAVPAGEMVVRFENIGKSFPIRKGQTICELAEEQGLKFSAQCHRGICGSDPIRIISGKENLNPIGDGEEDTLDDLCSIDDGEHRLACLARPNGPVVVEFVES